MVQGLNLVLKRLVLQLHALELGLGFVCRLTSYEACSCSANAKLRLQASSLFVSEHVLGLQVVELFVSLQEKLILSLDLLDVASNDAIVTVTFINESVQLINLVL